MPFEIKFCNCLLRVRNSKCFKCSVPFGRTNDWQTSFRNKFWWANYKSATLSKFSLEKLLYRLFSEMASYLITSVWRRKSFARKQFIKFCLTRKPHKPSQMNWLVKESWHKHVFRYVVLSGEYTRHQWYKLIYVTPKLTLIVAPYRNMYSYFYVPSYPYISYRYISPPLTRYVSDY